MHVFLTCFFSRNNSTTTHIRIYLNERELAKERMEVTFISVPVTQGSRARQRENPGLQREPREVDPSQDRPRGEGMAPRKQQQSSHCFSGCKFWSVPPLRASINGNTQSSVWPEKQPQFSPTRSALCIFA